MRRLSLLAFSSLAFLLTMEVTHAQTVGRTPGQFAVSPTGAATYTIPIWAPSGPKGVQPQIALTYNSQQGNGFLGVGWNLAGTSSISRCNLTYAQDGAPAPVSLATGDGYCLDGQRLRLTSGTYGTAGSTYQTEIANFQNVTAYGTAGNGPAYFIVQTPDGKTLQYGEGGTTSNAQVLASGTTTALSWMLDQVSDPAGNTMTVSYCASSSTDPNCPSPGPIGVVLPDTISWTPTTHGGSTYAYTMKFYYGTNVLLTAGFVAGTLVQDPYLLGSIIVDSSGAQVKEYVLTYQQSGTTGRDLLTQVQECAASTSNCLYPTKINYQSGSAGISTSPNIAVNTPVTSCVTTCGALARYDFNGDGYTDLYYCTSSGCYVAFGSASGYGAPVNAPSNALFGDFLGTGQPGILANNGGTWYYYTWNGSSFSAQSTGLAYDSTAVQFALADIDGDGRPDLEAFYASSGVTVKTRLNTSSTTAPSFSGTAVTALSDPSMIWDGAYTQDNQWGSSKSFDFNGDGVPDVLLREYNCVYFYEGTCGQYVTYYNALIGQPGGTLSKMLVFAVPGLAVTQVIFADVNNDACTDVVYQGTVYISSCNGTAPSLITTMWPVVAVMDWSGHGLNDLVENTGSNLYIQPSTGAGFSTNVVNTNIAYSTFCTYVAFHANGDGRDNLGCVDSAPGSNGFTYYLHNGTAAPPDLLSSIADGYGNSASPTYVSIVQGNYVSGVGTFPDVPYLQPIYVTSQVTYSDPSSTAGGTYNQTFQYYTSLMNVQGRGWDGFAETRMLDSRNALGLYDYRSFLTDFPYTGMQYEDLLSNGSITVSQYLGTPATPAVTEISTTPSQQRFFPYFSNVTTKRWEVGGGTDSGDLIATQSTNYVYDPYGNATSVVTTTTDNDPNSPSPGAYWTTSTANTFDIDNGNLSVDTTAPVWCLGLLNEVVVTYSVNPGSLGSAVTRTKAFTPDPTRANCRYTQIVTEPSSSTYKVTEALGYDAFGNVNSDAVTGVYMPNMPTTRTIGITWNATGQFPARVTNALNQSSELAFDPVWGKITSVTDPNLIVNQRSYDPAFGRLSKETRADGTYTQWAYNDCASVGGCPIGSHGLVSAKTVYNSDGSTMTDGAVYYDSVNRPLVRVRRMLANGAYSRNEERYDSLGNVHWKASPCTWTTISAVCASGTTFTYDVLNRPATTQLGSLAATQYTYSGRTMLTTDPNGHQKTTITNVNGSLWEAKDANGYVVTLGYDAAGSKTATTDNQGRTLWSGTVQYGVAPFAVTTTDSALGGRTYTYDSLGEVTSYSDANGNTFSAVYDPLSRMTSRSEPDLFTQWTWGTTAGSDNVGRLASVCTGTSANPGATSPPTPTSCTANSTTVPGYSENETYDAIGRLSQRSIVIPTVGTTSGGTYNYGYQYNTSGQLGTLTYPTTVGTPLKLQYNYSNGIQQSIVDVVPDSVTLWIADASNPAGQTTQETLGNSVVINRSFDPVALWLNSITAGPGGSAALENQSYLHDAVGNVIQRQENNLGLTENFHYDNLDRLDYSQLNSATNLQMCYDNAGGSCTENVPGPGSITSKTADAVAPSSYNATWTSYNYPSKIATASESVQFLYGPGRQRWQQNYNSGAEVTNYIGRNLEQVVTPNGTTYRQYVYAGAEPVAVLDPSSSGNAVTYMLSDHEGSIAALLNSSGASNVGESFTAYGARRNPSTWAGAPSSGDLATIAALTRQGYTFQTALGQSMGFNHMNGRVQDVITGQFMSPDPNNSDPTNTQDYNRYGYVRNNPLTFFDPSGFATVQVCFPVPAPPAAYGNPNDLYLNVGAPYQGDSGDSSSTDGPDQNVTVQGYNACYSMEVPGAGDGPVPFFDPPPSFNWGSLSSSGTTQTKQQTTQLQTTNDPCAGATGALNAQRQNIGTNTDGSGNGGLEKAGIALGVGGVAGDAMSKLAPGSAFPDAASLLGSAASRYTLIGGGAVSLLQAGHSAFNSDAPGAAFHTVDGATDVGLSLTLGPVGGFIGLGFDLTGGWKNVEAGEVTIGLGQSAAALAQACVWSSIFK